MSDLLERARAVAGAVPDPEVPVLTIEDLGVLRDVVIGEDGTVEVTVTPTYSGCPAMDVIRHDVVAALTAAGFERVGVTTTLSPAWTTDWMTDRGRAAIAGYGISPPGPRGGGGSRGGAVPLRLAVRCPQCGSPDTQEVSRFGSTACKSTLYCDACRQPFEQFKGI